MKIERNRVLKFGSGLLLGLVSAAVAIRMVGGSDLVQTIVDKDVRFIVGMALTVPCAWISFYITVFLWRKLLAGFNILTKEESKQDLLYIGIDTDKFNGT
jgi:hypothetical protein